jgi:hypothetical protein
MSVVVGIINKNFAVISSDSLTYTGYHTDNGVITKYAEPLPPRPKIFYNDKIIGGVCGLMDVDGKGIIEKITDILNENSHHNHVDIIRHKLIQEIHKKLLIEPIVHISKLLELTVISKEENDFELYYYRFIPVDDRIDILQRDYRSTKELKNENKFIFITTGSGWKPAFTHLQKQMPNKPNKEYFEKISQESINESIKNCDNHPYALPNNPSCGGPPNVIFLNQ